MGAYSVDDDWSVGYSGYSYDAPLLLGSLTEEAACEWIIVNPKKASKQLKPQGGSLAACPCHAHKGRYDVLSDCDSDFDRNVPLMMVANLEEGDAPPATARLGGAVFLKEAATA